MSEVAEKSKWAWPGGSPQEAASNYLDQNDDLRPIRMEMDRVLNDIRGSDGCGGMGWQARAEFIRAIEAMIDAKLAAAFHVHRMTGF